MVVVTAEFDAIAQRLADLRGRGDLGRVVLPYPLQGLPDAEIRRHANAAFTSVLTALGAT